MTTPANHLETFAITGMTCDHCVRAVTQELHGLSGVSAVTVDLASGTATVTSATPLDHDLVRAALDEAGYELAS